MSRVESPLVGLFGEDDDDRHWRSGDPCRSCGSNQTYLDEDLVPACHECGAHDTDE